MTLRAALLTLLAGLAPACITQEAAPPTPNWELTSDQPAVSTIGPQAGPQDVLPPGPASGQDAAPTQDDAGLLSLLTPATEADLDPDFLADEPPSPFHRLGHSVIRGMDGSWTKMYPLKSERSSGVLAMLQLNVPEFPGPVLDATGKPLDVSVVPEGAPTEIIKWVLHGGFYQDKTGAVGVRPALTNTAIADLLVVTAPPATLLFIDQLLTKLLADLPQIEIQVRVVEINLDDLIDWDAKVGFSELTDPSLPFDPTTNPPNGNFGSGFPILEGGMPSGYGSAFGSFSAPSSISGFLMSLSGVHNGLRVDALLSLLQTIGASELIQSPTVTVLNGHRAYINTGSEVPTFTATGIGTNTQVATVYKSTGVKVEIIPFIVGEDVVRVDLSVMVSAVTGEVPYNLGGTDVTTPIISTRDAGTTVHVHSGQTIAVGGLRSNNTIETITKVPVLGDIPILGWLFKSRSSRVRNTEIMFFITPTIRIPSETLIAPLTP
jgi:type II secretory pathway component GspD/PulD (secretin)